jgi:hypothetical protein
MTDVHVEIGLPKAKTKARQPDEAQQIKFEVAVAEGKRIVAAGESNAWELARIADQVEPKYGDKTLAKLAKAIGGIAACTLERRRYVCRKWKEIPASPPESFAVAQELAALAENHPERAAQIITEKPNITSREARKEVREYKKQENQRDPNLRLKEYQKWFKAAVSHANTVETDAQIVDDKQLDDPERRKILCEAIEPNDLPDLHEGANALIKLADFLQRLLEEASSRDDAQAT